MFYFNCVNINLISIAQIQWRTRPCRNPPKPGGGGGRGAGEGGGNPAGRRHAARVRAGCS